MFDVIIAASGESTRFEAEKNKLLININEYTVLENAVRAFLGFEELNHIILAVSESVYAQTAIKTKNISDKIIFCIGGITRTETVKKALTLVTSDMVLIHDGARPFVSAKIISDVLDALKTHAAAVPVVPIIDSLTNVSAGYAPVDRSKFRAVQTPQGFVTKYIKGAYFGTDGNFTDDVSVYLTKFDDVQVVEGEPTNKKITNPDDALIPCCRVGVGFDTHVLMTGRKLVLGGVTIPHEKGLFGHSDADVLTHAVMDALLSAAGRRDIGYHFPDTSAEFKNIDSFCLLKRVCDILQRDGYAVHNLSATVLAQKPKLSPYIPLMINNYSAALGVPENNVAILATTTEGVGVVGREEAMSAIATATIIKQ